MVKSFQNSNNIKIKFDQAFHLHNAGELDQAKNLYLEILTVNPRHFDSLHLLGVIALHKKLFNKALELFDDALLIDKTNSMVLNNKGNALRELGRYVEAVKIYEFAITLNPTDATLHINLGLCLTKINLLNEALNSYSKAIELNPNSVEAYTQRGVVLQELNRLDEALLSHDKAIELNPDFAEAQWNKSLLLLSLSDFKNGWQLYDWRWKIKSPGFKALSFTKPKSEHFESNENKKLLIWGEQGVGDQILYTGMVDQAQKIRPTSKIMVDKRLLPLLKRSMPQGIFLEFSKDIKDSEYDEHLPIADLGKYFRNTSKDFDISRQHYLIADQHRASEIRSKLMGGEKYLCGITWSSKAEKTGNEKTAQLQDLLPIFAIGNIAFVSLQYGSVQNQLTEFNKAHNINIQECESVDNFNDLDGHASLIQACDFVVAISNTSAHLAGAIGQETYLLCPSGKGLLWYWSNTVDGKSMWYPSIQIHQQEVQGRWNEPIQKIHNAIQKRIYAN